MLYTSEVLIFNDKFTNISSQLINSRELDFWKDTIYELFDNIFKNSVDYTLFFIKYENNFELNLINMKYNDYIIKDVNFICSNKDNVICLLKK